MKERKLKSRLLAGFAALAMAVTSFSLTSVVFADDSQVISATKIASAAAGDSVTIEVSIAGNTEVGLGGIDIALFYDADFLTPTLAPVSRGKDPQIKISEGLAVLNHTALSVADSRTDFGTAYPALTTYECLKFTYANANGNWDDGLILSIPFSVNATAAGTTEIIPYITAVSDGDSADDKTITLENVRGKVVNGSVTVVVPVTAIALNKATTKLSLNQEETLEVTYTPANTTEKGVTWASSDATIATVDATGKVKALKEGTATITATSTAKPALTATCTVNVVNFVALTGVSFAEASGELNVGENATLVPVYAPAATTETALTWASSNPAVATVDATGKVTAVAKGTANITATSTAHADMVATYALTVTNKVKEITLSKASVAVEKDTTSKVTATLTPADGDNAAALAVTSLNTAIATVAKDAAGDYVITGVANGSTTIEFKCGTVVKTLPVAVKYNPIASVVATAADSEVLVGGASTDITVSYLGTDGTADVTGDTDYTYAVTAGSATVTKNGSKLTVTATAAGDITITVTSANGKAKDVTIKAVTPITGINVTAAASMNIGTTQTVALEFLPADATQNKAVTFSSSDETVLTVDANGKVTALKVGKAKVTATLKANDTVKGVSNEISVLSPMTGIAIGDGVTALEKGKTAAFTVVFSPADTTDDKTVVWSTSDAAIATIDTNGVLTGVNAGTVTVKADCGAFHAERDVIVIIKATEIKLTADKTELERGETATITATVLPADASDKTVKYSTSNASVATVDANGVVTAVGAGTATITATHNRDNTLTGKLDITVTVSMTGISISGNDKLFMGGTTTLTAVKAPADTTDKTAVVWTSSNESIAKVNDGVVTGVSIGTATITATCGAFNATIDVTVTAVPNVITSGGVVKDETPADEKPDTEAPEDETEDGEAPAEEQDEVPADEGSDVDEPAEDGEDAESGEGEGDGDGTGSETGADEGKADDKGNPVTGVATTAGIAAVAGIAAIIASKKRK